MSLFYWSLSIAVLLVALRTFHKFRLRKSDSISVLPGPPPGPWLVGNIPDLQRAENVGDAEFEWIEKYGTAVGIKGALNEDIVYMADPKALHYMLNTGGYNFRKPKEELGLLRLLTGKGLLAVDGPDHVRHRKIMNPAFSYSSLKGFLPIFTRTAEKAAAVWRECVIDRGEASPVINVAKLLPRLTLDVIGEAALHYRFGALDNADLENANNDLLQAFNNLVADAFSNPTDFDIAFRAIWAYIPIWMTRAFSLLPLQRMKSLRRYLKVSFRVAQRLVDDEVAAITSGKQPGKDALSILVRANHGENEKGKLSDQELLAEMSTLIIAGHETTATTSAWLLYELSLRPDYQLKIRQEVKVAREDAAARGNKDLSVNDFDSMTYTVAAIKETLRMHPIVLHIIRIADREDTIPLSAPQRATNSEMLSFVNVSKGQKILMSLWAYNRLKTVWGEDAHQWRPERYIEGNPTVDTPEVKFGVYANIATFSSGVHGCIGWRFALLEMQAILIEVLEKLEFSPAGDDVEIIGVPAGNIVTTMVKGKTDQGTQLPLRVTPL